MKTGRSIEDLAREIMRQAQTKHDYMAPTAGMAVAVAERPEAKVQPVVMDLPGHGRFDINSVAHGQIALHTKIPKPYYDRMLAEEPRLLATNIDCWFKKYPADRLVRTLDNTVRAFLSSSYRPLENIDLAEAILPVLRDRKLEIMSCELTETKLYIKAVDTQLFRDVPVGYKMGDGSHKLFDTCAPAIVISNSEVGYGRLAVDTGVYTRACTNMALFANGGMKRTHLGARHKVLEGVENIDHLLSEKTKAATDKALWLQVRDVIAAAFDAGVLGKRLEQLAETAGRKIEGKVEKVVELTASRFNLNDGERESVLKHLIEGGSLTQYGLHSAVTRAAQDVADYDRATDLEYVGGRIVELAPTEWRTLAMAA